MKRLAVLLIVGSGALVLGIAEPAGAHAILLSSDPFDGEVLDDPPDEVTIEFNEPVTSPLGGVRVFDGEGQRVDRGDAGRGEAPNVLRVSLETPLDPGTYVATWRAISADTHPVRGAFLFEVRGEGEAGEVDEELIAGLLSGGGDFGYEVAAWASRALAYGGILLAAGGTLFLIAVHDGDPGERRRRVNLLRAAATVAGAGVVVGIPIQAALGTGLGLSAFTDGPALSEVAGDKFGASAAMGLAGLLVLAAALRNRPRVWSDRVALAGGIVAVTSLAVAGHNTISSPVWLTGLADVVHAGAGAVWVGGLVLLALTLRDRRGNEDAARAGRVMARFSTLAGFTVLVLAVAGAVLAWSEVRALRALTSTDYGLVLIGKLGLVAAILLVAGFNRFRLVPAIRKAGSQSASAAWRYLRRTVRVELVGVTAVLLVTAVLVNLVPAKTEAGVVGVFSTYTDLGDDAELNLVVDPNRVGLNEVHMYLIDATGRPADFAEEVVVRLEMPSKDIGPIERAPEKAGPGHWILTGRELSISGEWRIEVVARESRFSQRRAAIELYVNP